MITLKDYINENLNETIINEDAATIIATTIAMSTSSSDSGSSNYKDDDKPKSSKTARILSSAIRWVVGIGGFGLMTLPSLTAGLAALVLITIACMFSLAEPIDLILKSGFTDETVVSAVDDDDDVNEGLKDIIQKFKDGFKKMTHGVLVKLLMTNKKFATLVKDFAETHKEELQNKNIKMKELSKMIVDYFKEKKIDDSEVKKITT